MSRYELMNLALLPTAIVISLPLTAWARIHAGWPFQAAEALFVFASTVTVILVMVALSRGVAFIRETLIWPAGGTALLWAALIWEVYRQVEFPPLLSIAASVFLAVCVVRAVWKSKMWSVVLHLPGEDACDRAI